MITRESGTSTVVDRKPFVVFSGESRNVSWHRSHETSNVSYRNQDAEYR